MLYTILLLLGFLYVFVLVGMAARPFAEMVCATFVATAVVAVIFGVCVLCAAIYATLSPIAAGLIGLLLVGLGVLWWWSGVYKSLGATAFFAMLLIVLGVTIGFGWFALTGAIT
jgi:hypothetical protein